MRHSLSVLAVSLLAVTGCQNGGGYQQNQRTYQGAAIGAAGGALIGALSGDHNGWARAGIGAGIGTLAGMGIGAYMDSQEQSMRSSLQGTGIAVERQGNDLHLHIPENVTFAFDSSALQPAGKNALNNLSGVLRQYPETLLEITGHTDSTGAEKYNMQLSDRRANSVASYLSAQGVQQRMIISGVGETNPVASNDTEAGRAQNRRVEMKISPVVY
jgi:outer membrane protein OmpA-like peptidoglycan-associated protein